jgi:hypothetical protein
MEFAVYLQNESIIFLNRKAFIVTICLKNMPVAQKLASLPTVTAKMLRSLANEKNHSEPRRIIKPIKILPDEDIKILPDEEEAHPISITNNFDFIRCSEVIANLIKSAETRYSIGIYGEWGSGKTTLMKLIENHLNPELFRWERISFDQAEDCKLKKYLFSNFNEQLSWVENNAQPIEKITKPKYEIEWRGQQSELRKNKDNCIHISKEDNSESVEIMLKRNKAILKLRNETRPDEFLVERKNSSRIVRKNEILTVWFNAWRYESEENFALIPLMKTIAYTMGEDPMYKNLKQAIFRSLAILGKDALRGLAMRFFTEKGIQQVEDNISYKLARAVEFDKQVIYFEGLKKIEEEMQQIMDKYPGSKKRIVVFIDDLDRCSPEHAVEVFESIKVFLDIKGFVFVLGLSRQALDKLIVSKFAKLGVTDMTAEQYIRKIIQIEIQIPKWDESSIDKLIEKFFQRIYGESHNEEEIQKLMKQAAVELNPREAKRFMNKYIMVCEIYSETEIPRHGQNNGSKFDRKKYLLLEAFRRNWPIMYGYYKDGTIEFDEQKVKDWIGLPGDKRADYQYDILIKLYKNTNKGLDKYDKIVIDMGTEFRDDKLMRFISKYTKELKELRDYIESYDHISELSNIRIDTPSPAEDTDLLSKRRSVYTELWGRFKLLFSSVEDRTLLDLKGRSSVNTYKTARSLLESLQNWYYDYGGGLFMSARTRESYQALNSEVLRALSKHDDSQGNSQDDKLPEDVSKAIKDRAEALQDNMLKDMGV